jgi:hypothetical protein
LRVDIATAIRRHNNDITSGEEAREKSRIARVGPELSEGLLDHAFVQANDRRERPIAGWLSKHAQPTIAVHGNGRDDFERTGGLRNYRTRDFILSLGNASRNDAGERYEKGSSIKVGIGTHCSISRRGIHPHYI